MAEPAPDGAPRPTVLEAVHVIDGRARLRLRRRPGEDELRALIDYLGGLPRVTRVVARPNTGSVILEFEGAAADLMERLAESERVRLSDPPVPPPVNQVAKMGLLRLDSDIRSRTEGTLDFRTSLALVLVFLAIVQLVRGRIAGPTTTLLMSALSLLDPPKAK